MRNSLLSVIRRLYRAIRKSTLEGEPLLSPGVSIMTTLYPFVDIQSSIMAKSDVLEDDDVLVELAIPISPSLISNHLLLLKVV